MSATTIPRNVLAIIGTGGMGLASARRLAAGRTVFIADASEKNLASAAQSLRDDGHSDVRTQLVDVADYESVRRFAAAAAAASPAPAHAIETIVHTAGLSPSMAPANRILEVDLLGTANVIDAFYDFVGAGSSLTCIASIARFGAVGLVTPALSRHLGTAPRQSLLTESQELLDKAGTNPAAAYSISKAANLLRVQAAAQAWAKKGARINTISPGVIVTAMVRKELEGPSRANIEGMIQSTPMERGGTADEIASAVAFLAGRDSASYITGTDLVVDGGFVAGGQGALMQQG